MGMREKLIELIGKAQDYGCDLTDVVCVNHVENDALADYLIVNDVVPVVRCMECKHVKFDRCNGEYMCDHSYGGMVNVEARSFCSYGERRTDA